jgi:tRNA-specific 2-thiouridylase
MALGFDAVGTGHYARRVDGQQGAELHRATDPLKDQSYVLSVLSADQIAHSLFPLGDDVKGVIREEAAQRGLITASKPDSHDICFIPDGDTAGYLVERLGEDPGNVIDASSGEVIGRHRGTFTVTIGQRRGLDLKIPAEDGAPRYVIDVDVVSGDVIVGSPDLLDVWRIEATNPIWCGPALGAEAAAVLVQVRAHADPVAAQARLDGSTVRVDLTEPIRGLAPGQTVALYDGTRVVGSATVDATDRIASRSSTRTMVQ